jgi:membrane-bound lytic murein transglycosylase B
VRTRRSSRSRRAGAGAVVLCATLVAGACSGDDGTVTLAPPSTSDAGAVAATTATTPPSTTAAPPPTTTLAVQSSVRAPDGRAAPRAATTAAGLAAQLLATEQGLRATSTPAADRPDLGHLNQVAYRALSTHPEWDAEVLAALPVALRPIVTAHLAARREFLGMRETISTNVPAWEIRAPASADQLLAFYKEAEAATGIGWTYLAAINLVESGLGRISGLSTAGAIGPMQFLQSTWNERGIGQGDIRDPHDAIQAAARYLVRRGGPADMTKALRGYNNSANYVRAVTTYAQLFAADEASFRAVYHWEIYFFTSVGDLWFPVGYRQPAPIPVAQYLAAAPWSAPAPS